MEESKKRHPSNRFNTPAAAGLDPAIISDIEKLRVELGQDAELYVLLRIYDNTKPPRQLFAGQRAGV